MKNIECEWPYQGYMTISSSSADDPIEVSPVCFWVKLRIGTSDRHNMRYIELSPSQARQFACALLHAAENAQEYRDGTGVHD